MWESSRAVQGQGGSKCSCGGVLVFVWSLWLVEWWLPFVFYDASGDSRQGTREITHTHPRTQSFKPWAGISRACIPHRAQSSIMMYISFPSPSRMWKAQILLRQRVKWPAVPSHILPHHPQTSASTRQSLCMLIAGERRVHPSRLNGSSKLPYSPTHSLPPRGLLRLMWICHGCAAVGLKSSDERRSKSELVHNSALLYRDFFILSWCWSSLKALKSLCAFIKTFSHMETECDGWIFSGWKLLNRGFSCHWGGYKMYSSHACISHPHE